MTIISLLAVVCLIPCWMTGRDYYCMCIFKSMKIKVHICTINDQNFLFFIFVEQKYKN